MAIFVEKKLDLYIMNSPKTEPQTEETLLATPPLRMMTDRVLVVPSNEEGERATRGGLLIPATANDDRRLRWGDVVAVGQNVRHVKLGDRVLYAPDAGFTCEISGDSFLLLRERDIQAISEQDETSAPGLYL